MSCSSFQSQAGVASNIFTPAAALSTDIGLCRIDESNEMEGILMVRNNGKWGTVGVSYVLTYLIVLLNLVLQDLSHITHPRYSLQ